MASSYSFTSTQWGIFPEGSDISMAPVADLQIESLMPKVVDQQTFEPKYYAGELGEGFTENRFITDVPWFKYNRTVEVNRILHLTQEFGNINGAIVQNSLGFLYKGYTAPGELCPGSINYAYHSTPYKHALMTIPMVNCLLITLARKFQQSIISNYNEEYVKNMFSLDGVITTITGDEYIKSGFQYGLRKEGRAAIYKCGKLITSNIWGPGLQNLTPLYITLKKFSPNSLLELPYNVDPSSGYSNAYKSVIDLLIKKDARTGIENQWVYQFVPVQPTQLGYIGFEPEDIIKDLIYYDEDEKVHKSQLIKIGVVDKSVEGAIMQISDLTSRYGKDGHKTNGLIPTSCINSSALASCPTLQILASIV